MAKIQYVDPHIIDLKGVRRLKRVSFADRKFNESWFQKLLFETPDLLPTMDIEPAFSPCYAVARELPTKAGSIDLLFISPLGYLTIVETKLIRNPEARREVVTQILDYAKELSQWKYEDLIRAVLDSQTPASKEVSDPLFEIVKGHFKEQFEEEDLNKVRFIKSVEQCLNHGRFLLLIIGDKIREDVEWLVKYLQDNSHLQFTMGLVEIALFKADENADYPILVIPRIVARTKEIVRAIVRIEVDEKIQKLRIAATSGSDDETTPSLEAFWDAIREKLDAASLKDLRNLFKKLEEMGVHADPIESGVALRFPDPGGSDIEFRLFRVTKEGKVRVGFVNLKKQLERAGYDEGIAVKYFEKIAQWVGGHIYYPKKGSGPVASEHMFPIDEISKKHFDEYMELVKNILNDIRTEADKRQFVYE